GEHDLELVLDLVAALVTREPGGVAGGPALVGEPPRGVEDDEGEGVPEREDEGAGAAVAGGDDVAAVEARLEVVLQPLDALLAEGPVAVAGDDEDAALVAGDGRGEGAQPGLGVGPACRGGLGQARFGVVAEEDDGALLARPLELAAERVEDGGSPRSVGHGVGRVADEEHLVGDVGGGRRGRLLGVVVGDVGAGGGAAAEGEEGAAREERGEEAGGHGVVSAKRRRVATPPSPSLAMKRVPSGRKAIPSGRG